MIDKKDLSDFIDRQLENTDCFTVDVTVTADNRISVEIDSDSSVDIERCVELTRAIEQEFDRDKEDYELEVGSAGLTSPLRTERQYRKNLGNKLEVTATDGKKYHGRLIDVTPEGITIECEEKVKREGAKRPETVQVRHTWPYAGIRRATYEIEF